MVDVLLGSDLWASALRGGTALLLVAVGLYLPYRAGILNLGAEGIMLIGCYGAVLAAAKLGGDPWLGVLGGVLAGTATAALFVVVTLVARANVYVVGIALNFVASGGTAVLTGILYGTAGTLSTPDLRPLPQLGLDWLPVPWLRDVLGPQTLLVVVALACGMFATWWLANTQGGLMLRSTGVRPDVVQGLGGSVRGIQAGALIVGGALIGLGGAQLALANSAQFTPDMTAGRGFVALTLVFIAGTRCGLLIPLAVVFAAFDAIGVNLQALHLPTELSGVIPYLAVILLLIALRRQSLRRGSQAETGAPLAVER